MTSMAEHEARSGSRGRPFGRSRKALFPFLVPTSIGFLILLGMSLLVSAVAWNFVGANGKAQEAVTRHSLAMLRSDVLAYHSKTAGLPISLNQLVPAYTTTPLFDGWKRPLIYAPTPGASQPFDLFSAGPDGIAGTADDI